MICEKCVMGYRTRRTKRVFMNSVMNLAVSCRHLLCAWSNFNFQEVAGSMVLVVRKYSRKKEIMTEIKTERSSTAVSLCLSYVTSLCQHQLNRQLINWSGSGGEAYSGSGAQVDQLKQLRRFLTERCVEFSGRITQIGNPTRFTVHVSLDPKTFTLTYLSVFCRRPLQCNI